MSLTTVDQGLLGTYAQYTGFKNRIINGSMMIDQRNAGASVTFASTSFWNSAAYMLDRWNLLCSQASKVTVQQNAGSVTPPAGFANYLGVTSASAYSIGSGDYFCIGQRVEGFNFSDLAWGTANASAVTLSFKVYSSLTGTFGGAVQNSATNRSYPFTYTVSSANTWTSISVTIPGDTSGTWIGATNGVGLSLTFSLGVGSTYSGTAGAWAGTNYVSATGATSVVGTNGATFYITGVQLEKGSTATSFDYRPYGTELALCQRYFEKGYFDGVGGYIGAAGISIGQWIQMSVTKRAGGLTGTFSAPSTPTYSSATGTWQTQASSGSVSFPSVGLNSYDTNGFNSSWTNSDPRATGYWWISTEL